MLVWIFGAGLIALAVKFFLWLAPEGYQDRHGIHYGKPPVGWVPDEFS